MKNLGIILGRRPSDYAGGALPYEVRVPDGNWTKFLPIGEIQKGKDDWMDCVSRSLTNSLEIQARLLTGEEVNLNDRELALGSRTTREGNYLWRVAEYARQTGLAQQVTWPDSGGTFDEQYTPPPADTQEKLYADKKAWLAKWDIKDEDIPYDKKSLQYHLKHAPIQIVIPGHAMVDIYSPADIDRVMDSYPPYTKDIPGSYYKGPITFAKKIVLYKKEQAVPNEWLLVDIKKGDSGKQVEKLRKALYALGWLYPDPKTLMPYDDELALVVLNYQKANLSRASWAFWWALFFYRGTLVESETRAAINKSLTNIR